MSQAETGFEFLPSPNWWHSGLYVLEERIPCLAVILAKATQQVCEFGVYVYSYVGSGPEYFSCYASLVWPSGSGHIFRYQSLDIDQLGLIDVLPLAEVTSTEITEDRYFYEDPFGLTKVFCSHLPKLTPMYAADHGLESLVTDPEDFEAEFPDLMTAVTPDFWHNA